jgi:hypothetical protein
MDRAERSVILTEAANSLIVRGAAERPLYFAVDHPAGMPPQASPLSIIRIIKYSDRRSIESSTLPSPTSRKIDYPPNRSTKDQAPPEVLWVPAPCSSLIPVPCLFLSSPQNRRKAQIPNNDAALNISETCHIGSYHSVKLEIYKEIKRELHPAGSAGVC